MKAPTWSLRRRLLAIGLFAAVTGWAAGGAAMYWAAGREDEAEFDAKLAELAHMVMSFANHDIGAVRAEPWRGKSPFAPGSRYSYQIWSDSGKLIYASPGAPPLNAALDQKDSSYSTPVVNGKTHRTYLLRDDASDLNIQIVESLEARRHSVATFGESFAALMLVSFAALGLVITRLLRSTLKSVDATAAQLIQRGPLDLTPIHSSNPPVEFLPVVQSINGLFQRIEEAISIQRGFVAVAEHELRTPLAALRAHAQVAQRARDGAERSESLTALMRGVDRTAILLNQLLDLARLDALLGKGGSPLNEPPSHVELAPLVAIVLSDLRPEYARRQLTIATQLDAKAVIGVDFAMEMILRNLLRNAVFCTPPGGHVIVASEPTVEGTMLTVDDSGPGIPVAERERVFERFRRGPGAHSDGVGLGLSIVQTAAEAHGAQIHLKESRLGGLRVEIVFPKNWPGPTASEGLAQGKSASAESSL